jgi:hypothetical protein
MVAPRRLHSTSLLLGILLLAVSACTASGELSLQEPEDVAEETPSDDSALVSLDFIPPTDCRDLLPESALQKLQESDVELVRGPGSASTDPIFVEGQTPEELIGGLSCLFAIPGEEETSTNIILSAALVEESVRPTVINDLLGQSLNVGQTPDGALTYWIWGDEVIVPALHNALYPDSWYSALIQPGGRSSYDLGVSLVEAMRSHTTG